MHSDVTSSLTRAVKATLAALKPIPIEMSEPYLEYQRTAPGHWRIPVKYRPRLGFLDTVDYESLSREFGTVLGQHHPQTMGLVGTPTLGGRQLTPDSIVRSMVYELWKRNAMWDIPDRAISDIVQELESVMDSDRVTICYLAPIANLRLDADSVAIALPHGLLIRQLTDEEFTEVYGDSIYNLTSHQSLGRGDEFGFVGEFQEAMQIGESPADLSSFQMLWDSLNRAVLALRTFKQGPVGFTGIIFRAKHFCPFAGTQRPGLVSDFVFGFSLNSRAGRDTLIVCQDDRESSLRVPSIT